MEELKKIFSDIGTALRLKYNQPYAKYKPIDFAKAIKGIPNTGGRDALRFEVIPNENNTNEIDENGNLKGSLEFRVYLYDYRSNDPMKDVSNLRFSLENNSYVFNRYYHENSFRLEFDRPTVSNEKKDFVWDRLLITYTYKGVTHSEIVTYIILRTDEYANCSSYFNGYKDLRISGPNPSKDYATVRLNKYRHSEDGKLYFDVSENPISMGTFSFSSTGNASDYNYGNNEILKDYFRVCVNPSNGDLLTLNITSEHGDYLFYDAKIQNWGMKLKDNAVDFKTPNGNLFISDGEFRFNLKFWHWEYIFPNYRWVVASEGDYSFGIPLSVVIYDKSALRNAIDKVVYDYVDITDAVRVLTNRKVTQAQIDEQVRLLNA